MSSGFPVVGSNALKDDLDWRTFSDAILAGHYLPRAELADVFLGVPGQTTLSRAARIEGLGSGVKSVTAMANNPSRGLPFVHGAMAEGVSPRASDDDITLFKNGGGAHLDLMVADAILKQLGIS